MVIYGLKNCDTCRRAAKALGVPVSDLRDARVPEPLLTAALEKFGDALVNRRSTTWRSLSEADRARPVPDLIAEHPAVMKRPLICRDDALWLGWGEAVQAELSSHKRMSR